MMRPGRKRMRRMIRRTRKKRKEEKVFCMLFTDYLYSEIYDLGKKNGTPYGGHILVKSQPILKDDMKFGIAKKISAI